jgi:2',3'-cyclic-nucleotide 2'-phosphodiesterase (5'-nucleotidase family)
MQISVVSDSISDERYEAIIAPYREQIEDKMNEIIGFTTTGMISYRPESPLSNFLSDLILDFSKNYCKTNSLDANPSFSLFNHGGIRSSLPEGNVKVLDAYQIMPFENEIVILLLSGEQVVSLADYIATRRGEGVSGISFGMLNNNKAVDIKIQGAKIDVNRKYWMVTSDYIANGGDGMRVLTWAEERIDTGYKIRDVMIETFKEMHQNNEPIHGESDGRIYHVE